MDEYHLAEQVGEGSFGRVFKGRRRYTSQTVAIKLMQKHGKSEKDMRNLRQVRTRARPAAERPSAQQRARVASLCAGPCGCSLAAEELQTHKCNHSFINAWAHACALAQKMRQ